MPLYRGRGRPGQQAVAPLGDSSSIVLLGTSFRTADIGFRERFAEALEGADVLALPGVRECSKLSTCNRVEVYSVSSGTATDPILDGLGYGSREGFYLKQGLAAIRHLFGVAAGLDSLAVGEEQILRQVRSAGAQSRESGSSKSVLTPLFDAAYSSGMRARKLLRTPTGRSLSEMAIGFALDRLGTRPSAVLVAGTGETARLASRRLKGAKIYLLSGRRRAGRVIPNSVRVSRRTLRSAAARCQLIVSATRREGYVLSKDDVPDDGRRVVLDLGFPRNVDPALRGSKSVELLDLDDVASMARSDPDGADLEAAHRMVEAEAVRFHAWLTATRLNPALASIYRWAEEIRAEEASSAFRRLPQISERDRKVVEVMSRRLVSRLMAPHADFVKGKVPPTDQAERLRLLEKIFEREA